MNIDFNLDKIITELTKIKIPYLTTFIAFISSFNFWFLTIYFFNPIFISNHGIIITLMTTFSLTIVWYLIASVTVPKDLAIKLLLIGNLESTENLLSDRATITFVIFLETIIFHSVFFYLGYSFNWTFFVLISVAFFSAGLKYILTEILIYKVYNEKKQEQKKEKEDAS